MNPSIFASLSLLLRSSHTSSFVFPECLIIAPLTSSHFHLYDEPKTVRPISFCAS